MNVNPEQVPAPEGKDEVAPTRASTKLIERRRKAEITKPSEPGATETEQEAVQEEETVNISLLQQIFKMELYCPEILQLRPNI